MTAGVRPSGRHRAAPSYVSGTEPVWAAPSAASAASAHPAASGEYTSEVDASDVAAWWGAGVGSLALLWEIFRWVRSGPRLAVTVRRRILKFNLRRTPTGHPLPDPRFVGLLVEVSNVGSAATTLTHVQIREYDDVIGHLLRRPNSTKTLWGRGNHEGLPARLDPGAIWEENWHETKGIAAEGGFYRCYVFHSGGKPSSARLR